MVFCGDSLVARPLLFIGFIPSFYFNVLGNFQEGPFTDKGQQLQAVIEAPSC